MQTAIFITGASSGLGKALATEYANEDTILYLCGREKAKLNKVVQLCNQKGATVFPFIFDVRDQKESQKAILKANKISPITLLIANAGISGGVLGIAETGPQTRHVFDTNISGVLNVVLPTLELMRQQGNGQIAIISSIAGYRGMPQAPAYSASKACVKAWGEALRGWLWTEGVKVNVVCPGFIKTPLTDKNNCPMPFLMSPETAAKKIRKGLEKNRPIIAFPWPTALAGWINSFIPACILHPILRHLPKK